MGLLLGFAVLLLYVSVPLPTPYCLDYWWCVIVPTDRFYFILSPSPPLPSSTEDQTQGSMHIRQALSPLLLYSYGFWNSYMVIVHIYGRVSMVFQLFPKCLFVLYIIKFELFLEEWGKVCLLRLSGGKPHFQDTTFPVSYEISLLEDNGI